jgi:HK97 family phage major capsid protein
MPDSAILRAGAEALIPPDYAPEVFQGAVAASQVLTLGRRLPDMSEKQRRMPVLDVLPLAYFNNAGQDYSDTRFKKTSEQKWRNLFIDAEELSVIIPIPENVLEDTGRDVWSEVTPRIAEAMGAAIDAAVFHGTNAPNVWPDPIVASAASAGNFFTLPASGTDIYDALLGEDGVIAKLEEDGYMATGHAAVMSMRGKLRGLRDTDGQPIFKNIGGMQDATNYQLDGEPIYFSRNGGLDPALALLIAGDWSELIYAFRRDITLKVLTEAIIQDPADGSIVYNLAQQDMVALRATMRIGWNVANPVNRLQTTEANRYPFSVLFPQGVS